MKLLKFNTETVVLHSFGHLPTSKASTEFAETRKRQVGSSMKPTELILSFSNGI
jgi:hypothetical protein